MKTTFVINGQEPEARSIFAFEGMNRKQKYSFNSEHRVYVCRNSDGMFFSKSIEDAHQFVDEDSACNVIDLLNNSKNMNDCDWQTVLLVEGVEATSEQLTMCANNEL
jgi:hypothetical protein